MKRIILTTLFILVTISLCAQTNGSLKISCPQKYTLMQNYPNPFNPSTKIKFELTTGSKIRLTVFDLLGRSIKTLNDGYMNPGIHEINFDASDLQAGVYFYKLTAENYSETKRMILLK